MIYVIKRSGVKVPFDKQRIIDAINNAFIEVDGMIYNEEIAEDIANEISLNNSGTISVESIQDQVEDYLMQSCRRDVAKAYICYRYKRKSARDGKDTFFKEISRKLQAEDVQNSNANMDEKSFSGRVGTASDKMMKKYALDYCLSKMARENHLNNEIYIHDLSHYGIGDHNCLQIPFDKLLANGFNTRQVDIRPAQSINTAFQLLAVIFQLQSLQQFGGVAASHLDFTMEPYVKKSFYKHWQDAITFLGQELIPDSADDVFQGNSNLSIDEYPANQYPYRYDKLYSYALLQTKKEIHQAVEGMYHNLNSLQSRSGAQLPFSSINFGLCTSKEGRMVTKEILKVSIEGLGALHRTSIFPCSIFVLKKGVNRAPGDPNYDLYKLALKSTSQRLYPNYCNADWSNWNDYDQNNPCEYPSTMGCRTMLGSDINGLGRLQDGRGNACPVTIILPTIAMEIKEIVEPNYEDSDGNPMISFDREKKILVEEFMKYLDKKIHEAKDMLIERYEYMCAQSPDSAKFAYENGLMAGYDGKTIRSALCHFTLGIGQLGLAEALQILIGKDHTTEEGMELAKQIEQLFKDRCAEFKEEYKLNFAVYMTPAESLSHTAMKKFQARYGKIPNVSDREYFTNSIHCPVWKKMSPFQKIDIESQLTGYSGAGCITYTEFDTGIKNNLEGLEIVVNYAMDHDIPYFAVNLALDTCLDCGYTDEFNDKCPECGSDHIQQLRRVTG